MSDPLSPDPPQMEGENAEVFRWVGAKNALITGQRVGAYLCGGHIY